MSCYEILSVWGQWISGIGTVAVSIVLGIITYKISKKQILLTEQNIKLGLYNQRYEIYRKLENIIRDIISRNEAVRDVALSDLIVIRDDVLFLFDNDVHTYLLEIINKYQELSGYLYGETIDDNYNELISWFRNQYASEKILRKKFQRYLDLSDYGINMK